MNKLIRLSLKKEVKKGRRRRSRKPRERCVDKHRRKEKRKRREKGKKEKKIADPLYSFGEVTRTV